MSLTGPPLSVNATQWETIAPFYRGLVTGGLAAESVPGWLRRWSDLYKAVLESRARLKADAVRLPHDEAAQAALRICQEEVMPKWMAAKEELTGKLLAAEGFHPGPDHLQMMRRLRNQHGLFREGSVPLDAQLSAIEGEYRALFANLRAEAGRETLSLAQASARLTDLDGSRREEAWRAAAHAWLGQHEEIGRLLITTLRLRKDLARVAGLPNFLALRWREMDRIDYTPSDAATFDDAVASEIVPLSGRLIAERRSRLSLPSVRPWDLAVDRSSLPPLQPFRSVEQLKDGVERMLSCVDQEIGDLFARMRDGWMDLEPRAEKPAGGEEWSFPQSGMPYIVANAVGTHSNVLTVLHESGHAVHDYLSLRHQDLIWNAGGPTEFEELAAGALVFLADPYLQDRYGGFYTAEEAQQGRTGNVEYYMHFLRQVATMDAFERWLYSVDPINLTIEAINQAWLALARRFDPDVDWRGLEQERASGWLQLSHFLFGNPCYYLTYGLSILGAFQVWQGALQDQEAAVAAYKRALARGNTQPLPTLFGSAGAQLPFDDRPVRDTARFVSQLLLS